MPVGADKLGFVHILDGSNNDLPLPWVCDFCDGGAVFHFRYRHGLREAVGRLGCWTHAGEAAYGAHEASLEVPVLGERGSSARGESGSGRGRPKQEEV
ncbi:hypothetical protein [Streptomyces acidiscabies]|uniref:Uncharacterized protein n=1 Tax=Streptomyces acidiscabies TaxID=42234 RepID=A0ABU4LWI5_9ACTN|nr:hypothetical protein [Streptomyces acidiscabies]MDX3020080.1 hypothetical protein [Streptomyces acidiscabies]